MEILANYVDVDRLVSPEVESEQLYPTMQNQKIVLTQSSLKTISITTSIAPQSKLKQTAKQLQELSPSPIKMPEIESISIFQNEKFKKLCSILERSLEEVTHKPVQPEPNPLQDHILAERIRELSEDLRISQEDLKDHQIAIRQIANKYKEANKQLSASKKRITDLQKQVEFTDTLKVTAAHVERNYSLPFSVRQTV